MLKLAGFKAESIVDGPGIRATIYFQGCPHCCPGCHNLETHDPEGGFRISLNELVGMIKNSPGISGVTFSGGEPFLQAPAAAALAVEVAAMGLNLVLYSGYTYEQLAALSGYDPAYCRLLNRAWLLIDGPYIAAEKDLDLPYRGSRNQRIIDLPSSLAGNETVEWIPVYDV